jgi:endonuclease-3
MDKKRALKQLNILGKNGSEMRLAAESWKNDFERLISIILSARTRDEITIPIATKLFNKYPSAKKLANAKLIDIEKIIKPINFYKNKSKNIIACSNQLVKNYNEKIPKDQKELEKLSGVGIKTANVFLNEVGIPAIGVDTHVSYISQKLGWTKNKNPKKIGEDLMNLFPQKYWNKVNSTLVRFGKTHTSRKEKDKLLEEIKNV